MSALKKFYNKLMAATVSSLFVLRLFDKFKNSRRGRRYIKLFFCWIGFFRLIGDLFRIRQKECNGKEKIAIVAIVKNEAPYIGEWIEYHKLIGIEKFYVFDNDSTDNLSEIIKPYVEDGTVVYQRMGGSKRQIDAYNYALRKYGKFHEYFAVIDLDEFIFMTGEEKLIPFLDHFFADYPQAGGCAVNWAIFGSSGYKEKPDAPVTQVYLYRGEQNFEKNRHIKTICRVDRVWGFLGPHCAVYKKKFVAISTKGGDAVYGSFTKETSWNSIRINHYFTKSFSEFQSKRDRGKADADDIRTLSEFDEHDVNDVYDNGMVAFMTRMETEGKERREV